MVSIKTNSPEIISNGELWNGVVLERSEILDLSEQLSHLYIELIEKLSSVSSAKYDLPQDGLRIILRNAIVPITHCFFERLIRLKKVVSCSKSKPLVAEQGLESPVDGPSGQDHLAYQPPATHPAHRPPWFGF